MPTASATVAVFISVPVSSVMACPMRVSVRKYENFCPVSRLNSALK